MVEPRSYETATKLLLNPVLLGDFPDVAPMTTWEWLQSMRCGRRRRALVRAWHQLQERGERHHDFGVITPFVKTENLPWFGVKDGLVDIESFEYVPRLIQAPHDETHIVAGPYLKPLTLALKRRWHCDNWIFYASTTPETLDAWLNANSHCASYFWSDYTAFDSTYSKHSWWLLEGFYRVVYPDAPREFWEVLDVWRSPRGKAKMRKEGVELWYRSEEMNASGRDDTALANALLNGLVLALSFAAALAGKAVSDLDHADVVRVSGMVRIAVVGDDSLVCCDFAVRPFVPAIEQNIQSFGLVVKAECSVDLWDVTFLGSMPYLVAGKFYWGPTLGRRLYKAFWQADPMGHLPAWTKGVALQLSMFRHVPFLVELADRVLSLLQRHAGVAVYDENKPYQTRVVPTPHWDNSTVEWLCHRYHRLTPGMLVQDLQVVAAIQRLPCVIHSDVFNACVVQDDL